MIRTNNNNSHRNVSRFAAAALTGIATGSLAFGLAGCNSNAPNNAGAGPNTTGGGGKSATTPVGADMHACAGLNGCKGQGADGKNACAGQGGCASAGMKHECKGHNACKGQGGCGEMVSENSCKGQGGCAVPVTKPESWKMARGKFEAKMKTSSKEFGPAPAKS